MSVAAPTRLETRPRATNPWTIYTAALAFWLATRALVLVHQGAWPWMNAFVVAAARGILVGDWNDAVRPQLPAVLGVPIVLAGANEQQTVAVLYLLASLVQFVAFLLLLRTVFAEHFREQTLGLLVFLLLPFNHSIHHYRDMPVVLASAAIFLLGAHFIRASATWRRESRRNRSGGATRSSVADPAIGVPGVGGSVALGVAQGRAAANTLAYRAAGNALAADALGAIWALPAQGATGAADARGVTEAGDAQDTNGVVDARSASGAARAHGETEAPDAQSTSRASDARGAFGAGGEQDTNGAVDAQPAAGAAEALRVTEAAAADRSTNRAPGAAALDAAGGPYTPSTAVRSIAASPSPARPSFLAKRNFEASQEPSHVTLSPASDITNLLNVRNLVGITALMLLGIWSRIEVVAFVGVLVLVALLIYRRRAIALAATYIITASLVTATLLVMYKIENVDLGQAWFYTAHTFLDSTPDSWLTPACRADPTENCREANGLSYFGPANLRDGVLALAMNHPLVTLAKSIRSGWDNAWVLAGPNLSTFPFVVPFLAIVIAALPEVRAAYRMVPSGAWLVVGAIIAESALPPLTWAPPHPQYHVALVLPVVMLLVPALYALLRMSRARWLAFGFLALNAGLSAFRYSRYPGY